MNTIEVKGINHLEHIIEHLADGIVPIFEIRFFDKYGLKYGHKYFHNLAIVMKFINNDKFQKQLKDGNFKEKIFFDSEKNIIIWEYRK